MTFCSIYKITNLINNKPYIGQTWYGLYVRYAQHCSPYNKGCTKIHNAIQKYGKENFKIELLTIAHTQEIADYWEKYFIQYFDSVHNGYNLNLGGANGKHSEVSKARMRKPKSEETKAKMRKPKSERAKANMRKPKSEKAKRNMSGRTISEKTRNIMKCNAQKNKLKWSKQLRGRKQTRESTEKLSMTKKGKPMSEEAKLNMRRTKLTPDVVMMIREDSKKDYTFKELSIKYNVARSTIGKIITGKTHNKDKSQQIRGSDLTIDDIRAIRRNDLNLSRKQIAIKYNICVGTVINIINYRTHKYVK